MTVGTVARLRPYNSRARIATAVETARQWVTVGRAVAAALHDGGLVAHRVSRSVLVNRNWRDGCVRRADDITGVADPMRELVDTLRSASSNQITCAST